MVNRKSWKRSLLKVNENRESFDSPFYRQKTHFADLSIGETAPLSILDERFDHSLFLWDYLLSKDVRQQ